MTDQTITPADLVPLGLASRGMYRPQGAARVRAMALVDRGLLGFNYQTRILFLTEDGAAVLSA